MINKTPSEFCAVLVKQRTRKFDKFTNIMGLNESVKWSILTQKPMQKASIREKLLVERNLNAQETTNG